MSISEATQDRARRLREATKAKAVAVAAWEEEIRDAAADDMEVTAIAKEAGITRKTVYSIINRRTSKTDLMDAALGILMANDHTGHAAAGLGSSDRLVKARRVSVLAKNISPGQYTDEELRQIGFGNEAALTILNTSH
jgi:hypothetical protein